MVKFLIIRFSSIGDIVLTTPVIRCLKKQVEGSEIHYLTKDQFSPVLEENPYIDKLWLLKNDLKSILKELEKEEFDYIIDLHHNLRSLRVKNKLRKLSFSFNKLNFQKWLLVNFKINKLPAIHIVDRYMNTVKVFNVINDQQGLDYFLPGQPAALGNISSLEIPEKYIALVIGAQHETKKADAITLSEICDKVHFPVVILGGKDDRRLAESIMRLSVSNKSILDTTGRCTLHESALLVKNAELVITHDTGLMHIAAAFKKKIISIWGNTIPEFGMYPYLPDTQSRIFEVKNLSCRPCSKIGHQACPRKHFKCMKDQDKNEIAAWAGKLISH